MKEITNYESPKVRIVQVEVEKGFATSQPRGEVEDMHWGTWN